MNNKLDLMNGFFNGLNLNPIPLEASQSMTTTKWLMSILSKIDDVIKFTNDMYSEILKDLEDGGILYDTLSEKILAEINITLSTLNADLLTLTNAITTIENDIKKLQYLKPTFSVNTLPIQKLYRVGETINSIIINFTIIKGSEALTKAEVYKNNVLISTINTLNDGLNTYVDGSVISEDSEYIVKIYDGQGVFSSESIKYDFVNNVYVGLVSVNDVVNSTFIKTLSSLKISQGDIDYLYNSTNEKIIIAFPTSYGDLISIIADNEELIMSFIKSILIIDGINYNVYTLNDYVYNVSDTITFKF